MRLVSAITAITLTATAALAQTAQERRWCEGDDGGDARSAHSWLLCRHQGRPRQGRKSSPRLQSSRRGVPQQGRDRPRHPGLQPGDQAQSEIRSGLQQPRRRLRPKGDFDRAIQDYEQAIKLSRPRSAHFNRGNAYLGKSQYDAAIDDYNQAIQLKSDFAPAFDNRCWARAVVGILQKALADCNEALRLMPNNPATLDSRGFVFLKMTHFDAAVSDYDAALAINPKLASALYGRGVAKLKNEDAARRRRHRGREGDPGRHRRGIRALRDAPDKLEAHSFGARKSYPLD